MYGFIAIFDKKTEQFINDVWRELKEKSISLYAYEVENRIPHITLASYNSLNLTDFIKELDIYYKDKSVIDLTFNTLGTFLNSGTLFYSPIVTKDLFEFHSNHHKYFKRFNDNNSLYLPGSWIPHCTIANRLPSEKLVKAFNYCSSSTSGLIGKIKEVALIDLSDKSRAPIIFSKELNE